MSDEESTVSVELNAEELEEFEMFKDFMRHKREKETKTDVIEVGKEVGEDHTTLELTDEEVQPIRTAMQNIRQNKLRLANLVAHYEEQKAEILELIDENQQVFDARVEAIREKHGFPKEGSTLDLHEQGRGATVTW